MRKIDKKVLEEVQNQLEKAHTITKQSTTIFLGNRGTAKVTSYWVVDTYRVDINLKEVKEQKSVLPDLHYSVQMWGRVTDTGFSLQVFG